VKEYDDSKLFREAFESAMANATPYKVYVDQDGQSRRVPISQQEFRERWQSAGKSARRWWKKNQARRRQGGASDR